ncbi:hypothetical protein ABE458_31545, partial [Pseudomonas protegens]|uniref:hypothetical protein n=1 Tax=Pseudomonas protegens TaxID=380021 RepID=UPI00320B9E8D
MAAGLQGHLKSHANLPITLANQSLEENAGFNRLFPAEIPTESAQEVGQYWANSCAKQSKDPAHRA